jgi:hypothetical protein
MKNFCGLACIILFLACNSGTDQQADGVDTTSTQPDTVVSYTPVDTSSEFIETFSSNLQPWLDRNSRQTTIRLDNFKYVDNWLEDSLIISDAKLTPEFYQTYKQVLVYSPDSSKVLDLGSYGAMVSTNAEGKSTLVQGEPDSEIAVLDRLSRKRRRIFFLGPGSSVDQGFWINDSTVLLAGRSDEQGVSKPVIWTVRLEEGSNLVKRYEPRQ